MNIYISIGFIILLALLIKVELIGLLILLIFFQNQKDQIHNEKDAVHASNEIF
jgi:hypothetical protein